MNLQGPQLLDALRYIPSIRSRQAELRGFSELRPETKDAIHPIVSLGKNGRMDQSERVVEAIAQRVGQCFLDLNTYPGQACSDWERLCDPANAYGNWRDLLQRANGVTPVALLREGVPGRAFVRQVILLEREFGAVVIRSRQPAQDLAAMQAALSAVDDVNNLLIILDLGYIRGAVDPKETEARRIISALRTTDPTVRVCVTSSSYPKAVSVYGEFQGSLEIIERELHAQIGGDEVAIYGDHASIYPEPFEPVISRFVPRIDYCLEYTWLYHRRREDAGGYAECARQIVASADWDPAFANDVWGAALIARTARTGVVEPGFGSPANWIAVRVNMHIERQANLAASIAEGIEELF
ncbi:beta family protein [Aureimonas sp. AU4]|uniref:beta family protein n=1 Tax=Aureimonas sp. AU4 TaxID=1638163 RepID=UPI00070635E8|nr:beta family protein [Aureimonas sp. AU4]BAT30617.1 hypothetical protein [Aureimonas sp. AU4]